jgi:hypothetical protein
MYRAGNNRGSTQAAPSADPEPPAPTRGRGRGISLDSIDRFSSSLGIGRTERS